MSGIALAMFLELSAEQAVVAFLDPSILYGLATIAGGGAIWQCHYQPIPAAVWL
ncbi:hypothetical protein D3C77_717110 [compost metagenome]